jgi:oligopeptide/dipeptide ABC transporter ATP-binding protein
VVRHISDRVAVMYLGRIVEIGTNEQVFGQPLHPYTVSLQSAVPIPDPEIEAVRKRIILTGDVPSAARPPSGCHFRTRCPLAVEQCATIDPQLRDVGNGHQVACIRVPPAEPGILPATLSAA